MSDLPPLNLPYRATALLHAGLAVMILLVAWLTGGGMTKALLVAVGYFVVATGWSWFRLRQRERRAARSAAGGGGGERT